MTEENQPTSQPHSVNNTMQRFGMRPDYQDIFVKSLNGHEVQGCETLVQSIERTTMRTLTMETSLSDHLDKCNTQNQSPLYSKLPKEIRDLIFEFATAQYEDVNNPYKTNAFYYRPGHRGPLKTSTALLRTCRRIWLEANALPMKQSKKMLWLESDRGPPKNARWDFACDWTSLNKRNYHTLHLFTQKHMAERLFKNRDSISATMYNLRPKVLRVTWRHTDWFRWEDPLPLELNESWIERALSSKLMQGVQRFELELETLTKNKSQLEAIVDRISKLQGSPIPSASDKSIATQLKVADEPRVSHWTGPPDINDVVETAHEGMGKLDYHVMTLTWKAVPAAASDQEPSQEIVYDEWAPMRSRGYRFGGPQPPRMITHTVRLHLLQGGWQRRQFPFASYLVRKDEMEMAERTEQQRRMQFCKAFADINASKIERRWEAKKSLLKFED